MDALPTVTIALRDAFVAMGEVALAEQLVDARVHALCECGEPGCLTFYLSPPVSPCPGGYRVVLPIAVSTVGVCDGTITVVEDEAIGLVDAESQARLTEYLALEGVVPRRVMP